jgi:uncharacterized protein YbjT (DUF2867 family)
LGGTLGGMTILITGGTGKTGRRVAQLLTDLGHPIRAVSRHSDPAFDWYDERTWPGAIGGTQSAYVTFQPDIGLPGADEIIGRFARTAVAAGCQRLVLLSGRGEEAARRAERALADSGADWTVLRSAFFMQNFTETFFAEEIAGGSLSMVEHSVGEPFVDADDLAEVAVSVLRDPGHTGRTYELTGPSLLTFEQVAAEIGVASGRDVAYRECSVDDYVAELVRAGFPEEDAAGLGYLFHEVLDGRNAHAETGVRSVLGRQPRTFQEFLESSPLGAAAVRG